MSCAAAAKSKLAPAWPPVLADSGGAPLTVHAPAPNARNGRALVYYHGGGFLYGERDDLPRSYVEMFTRAGYTIVAFDYPLAPELSLEESVTFSLHALCELVEHGLNALDCAEYALFGRSAGAYLALKLAALMQSDRQGLEQPRAVLDFYGYWQLDDAFMTQPSTHYLKMPAVDKDTAKRLAGAMGELVFEGPRRSRFALYVHARQTGCWGEMLGLADTGMRSALSLSNADVAALPPVFIAASTGDADVPLKQSKTLWRRAPHAQMHQVYYLEHDFDRDTANPAGREAYEHALAFLAEVFGAT